MTVDDSIIERITRIEVSLENVAHHTDVVRLEERVIALSQIITKFIELKDFHNGVLEKRMTEVEKNLAQTNVYIAPIPDVVKRVSGAENRIAGVNVILTIIGVIGTASLAGVISLLLNMLK